MLCHRRFVQSRKKINTANAPVLFQPELRAHISCLFQTVSFRSRSTWSDGPQSNLRPSFQRSHVLDENVCSISVESLHCGRGMCLHTAIFFSPCVICPRKKTNSTVLMEGGYIRKEIGRLFFLYNSNTSSFFVKKTWKKKPGCCTRTGTSCSSMFSSCLQKPSFLIGYEDGTNLWQDLSTLKRNRLGVCVCLSRESRSCVITLQKNKDEIFWGGIFWWPVLSVDIPLSPSASNPKMRSCRRSFLHAKKIEAPRKHHFSKGHGKSEKSNSF